MYFPILIPTFQFARPLDPKSSIPLQSHKHVQNCDSLTRRHLFQLTFRSSEAPSPNSSRLCYRPATQKKVSLWESNHIIMIHQPSTTTPAVTDGSVLKTVLVWDQPQKIRLSQALSSSSNCKELSREQVSQSKSSCAV